MKDSVVSAFRCVHCHAGNLDRTNTQWRCRVCGQIYACTSGIPRLYLEARLGAQDRALRDLFYDGFVGRYYQFVMPFLAMPARPMSLAWSHWLTYAAVVIVVAAWLFWVLTSVLVRGTESMVGADLALLAAGAVGALFFWRHRYIGALIVLALPAKLALLRSDFRPEESFSEVHKRVIRRLGERQRPLRILDVSTGTCNSLHRHGWMDLDAEYVGLDLSATMLEQGQRFMSCQGVPVHLVLGDAADLPFADGSFDAVLNYGAVNAMTDPGKALAEMVRVAKPGGLVLFLDEQLYPRAYKVERLYFDLVLSSHNSIHRCPVELLPSDLIDVEVKQVYHFYYICIGWKRG